MGMPAMPGVFVVTCGDCIPLVGASSIAGRVAEGAVIEGLSRSFEDDIGVCVSTDPKVDSTFSGWLQLSVTQQPIRIGFSAEWILEATNLVACWAPQCRTNSLGSGQPRRTRAVPLLRDRNCVASEPKIPSPWSIAGPAGGCNRRR
jgi:hypothetical protein